MTHTRQLSILININPCFKLTGSIKPYMTSHAFYSQVYRYLHILGNYKTALLYPSLNIIGHVPLQCKSVVHTDTQQLYHKYLVQPQRALPAEGTMTLNLAPVCIEKEINLGSFSYSGILFVRVIVSSIFVFGKEDVTSAWEKFYEVLRWNLFSSFFFVLLNCSFLGSLPIRDGYLHRNAISATQVSGNLNS